MPDANRPAAVIDPFEDFAEIYEITHKGKEDDLPLYLDYAKEVGSPILEIGCGTGRVTLALAAAGHAITGIDISENMLKIARKKLAASAPAIRKRVDLHRQDMSMLDLPGQRFPLVMMPYGEFAHVLERERQDLALAAIRRHMDGDGLLIIGMSNWDPREARISYHGGRIGKWGHSMPLNYEGVFQDDETGRTLIRYLARGYDPSLQIAIHVYVHEITDADGRFVAKETTIVPIRYVFRYEMEMLLEKAGFAVENIYGYYDRSPFTHDSRRMIFVARAK